MNLKDLIYVIREKQVILDSDVAKLYNYETKRLIEAVKRNKNRFPESFCFQLNDEEYKDYLDLRSQFATLKEVNNRGQHKKYLPYAFTEQGIAMLSGLLRSEIAVKVSINIMTAFVEMRRFLNNNVNLFDRVTTVEYKLLENDKKFDLLFNELQKGVEFKQKIFFEGQIYDAYSLIVDIVKKAKKSIILIDNYIDKSVLDIFANKQKGINIKIVTSDKLSKLDGDKFNKQYPYLEIINSSKFHDRFVIIDEELIYHLGASIKDLGKKCFAINKMEDRSILERIG